MSKNILLISFLSAIIGLSNCNLPNKKSRIHVVDSVFIANNITIDTSKNLLLLHTPLNDCQSCMYRANQVFNELLKKDLKIPKSNIVFLFNDIRDKEIAYLFKQVYTLDIKKYQILKSDILIDSLLAKNNLSFGGTCIFVLDKNKELLYYNFPKKISNLDSLISVIEQ